MKIVPASLLAVSTAASMLTVQVSAGDLIQHSGIVGGGNCVEFLKDKAQVRSFWCGGGDEQLFEVVDGVTLRPTQDKTLCFQHGDDNLVRTAPCDGRWEQRWRFNYDGTIGALGYNKFGKCLDAVGSSYPMLTIENCNPGRASQMLRSSVLERSTGTYLKAGNGQCLDWSLNEFAVPHPCHGYLNQNWELTHDEQLRTTENNCLQYDEAGLEKVNVVKCDMAAGNKQRWMADPATGRITPRWNANRCLDIGSNPAKLVACSAYSAVGSSVSFNVRDLIAARNANMKRMHIHAPMVYTGTNCMIKNGDLLHINPCNADKVFWWEITSQNEIKIDNKCLDMSLNEPAKIILHPCNGGQNQQWNWNAKTGVFTTPHPSGKGKCLAFNTVDVKTYDQTILGMQPCNEADPGHNMMFRPRQFNDMPAPTLAAAQQEYCSQRKTRVGDLFFLRNTLIYKNDLSAYVPSTLDGAGAYNYYASVVLETVSLTLQTAAHLLTETAIVEKLGAIPNGNNVLFDLAELMCRVREQDAALKPKILDWLNIGKPANWRMATFINFVRMANLQIQMTTLPSDSTSLSIVSDNIGRSINDRIQEFMNNNDMNGLIGFVTSRDMTWFSQQVETVCAAKSTLSVCSVTYWSSLVKSRQDLLDEITKATTVSLNSGELITEAVLKKTENWVAAYKKGLAAGSPVNAKVWISFAQTLVFGSSKPVAAYPLIDMLRTVAKPELMMVLTLWPFMTADDMNGGGWGPFFTALGDQLYNTRRREIERIVYTSRVTSLEAYLDGRTSDAMTLITQVFPKICAKFSSNVCLLAKFYQLTMTRSDLQRMITIEEGAVTSEIERLGAQFAQIFTTYVGLGDQLWTMTAVRLLFNSVELQIYPAKTLILSARPNQFLRIYPVFAAYTKEMAPLLGYFTFFIDQVSVAHFNAINALVSDRNVDGMVAYMKVNATEATSDLGVLGTAVLPIVCNNPNNPDFSICKLQDFYTGLQQVVAFEKSRRAKVVPLADLLEVDVRKQLDVIDGENKQFEIITTIQDSANQIGQKIQEESDKIQDTIKTESAAIRNDIAASTQVLYDKMGEEGRALQKQIDESTRYLEETIGEATDAIRDDIARNTKLLYDKMDKEARALQDSITENTRKLSSQIGAEAAATRQLIKDSTAKLYNKIGEEGRAIRGKIDESTAKLYNKIGEEGQKTRTKIDQSTERLYNKIGEEGQKTRNKIDESTRTLTNVINTSTKELSQRIDASTNNVVSSMKKGFTALADYYKSDAKVNEGMIMKNLNLSISNTNELRKRLENQVTPFREKIQEAVQKVERFSTAQSIQLGLKTVALGLEIVMEAAKCFNPFAKVFGTADPARAVNAMAELHAIMGKINRLGADVEDLKRRSNAFAGHMSTMENI